MAPTQVGYLPKGFHSVTPYVHPAGAARFIDFLKEAFGAEELFRYDADEGKIMHAEVRVGDSMIEMGDTDPLPTALHLYVPNVDEVYHHALSKCAKPVYAPMDQPYGDRESGVRDPVGNLWFIATHQGESHVRPGLHTVTPFLMPRGAAHLIGFLKSAFGGEEVERRVSPDGLVQYATIRIGDSIVEMGDAHGEWEPVAAALHLYVPDTDAVYRQALAAGATSMSEPEDKLYGDRAAGVRDAFGNIWYIATHVRD